MRKILAVKRECLFIVITSLLFSLFTTHYVWPDITGPGWIMGTTDPGSSGEPADESGSTQGALSLAVTNEQSMSVTTTSSTSVVSDEIRELARALQYDPQLIYEYVHNHIDYVPYYGLLKGATLTYLDGSGNDFDQAALMVELLRESNFSADYVFGRMTIPNFGTADDYDLQHWLGVSADAAVIDEILKLGGIPATVSASTTDMDRVWVKVSIGNSDVMFDPAFKKYEEILPSIDLENAMGYDQHAVLAAAGGDIGTDYVSSLNENGINNTLVNYSSSLIDRIKSDLPNAEIEEIVGDRKIVPQIPDEIFPYDFPNSNYGIKNEIADTGKFSTITIEHGEINHTEPIHEIAGKRLSISYESYGEIEYDVVCWSFAGSYVESTRYYLDACEFNFGWVNFESFPVYVESLELIGADRDRYEILDGNYRHLVPPGGAHYFTLRYKADQVGNHSVVLRFNRSYSGGSLAPSDTDFRGETISAPRAQLWLDDEIISEETYPAAGFSRSDLLLTVDHPYSTISSDYADQEATYNIIRGASYAIISDFGGTSDALLDKRQKVLEGYMDQGLTDTSPEVLGESLNIMGLNWMKQIGLTNRLLSNLADTVYINHHNVGIMAQEGGYYIDVKQGYGNVIAKNGNPEDAEAHFKTFVTLGSAFEHGTLEQLMFEYPAISTVKLLQIANDSDKKIFLLNSTNFLDVEDQLINYDQSLVNDHNASTDSDFATRAVNGWTFILPEDGQLGIDEWNGHAYIGLKFTDTSKSAQMAIDGGYFGAYTVQESQLQPPRIRTSNGVNTGNGNLNNHYGQINSLPDYSFSDPVDVASGAFVHQHTDIALGGGAPMGLAFTRLYSSDKNRDKRTLGNGWTHNYDTYLKRHSHGDPGLGTRQPVDAAALIAGLYTSLDLMKTDDTDMLLKWVVSSLIGKWSMDQLTGEWINGALIPNAVTVYMGNKSMEFIKLPDGSYSPPPGSTTRLLDNGDNTFSLEERFGTKMDFDSHNRITQLTDIDGNTLTFNYNSDGLQIVQDTFGRTITLNYSGGKIDTVTDSAGRSVLYNYTGDDLTGYTDPEGKLWGYGYDDPDHPHHMTALSNPRGDITAANTYDSLGRVDTQTVPRQNGSATYNFYFSGFRNVEEDPDGNTTIYYFDEKGRPVGEEDKLGHKISKEYDGQFHVVKVTDPLLNETTFEYDGNQNLLRTMNALLQSTCFHYDSDFRLTDTSDPLLHGSHITYDSKHHPTDSEFGVQYDGNFVPQDNGIFRARATYYNDGLTHTTTDGRGTVTTLTYDPYGNPEVATTGSHPPLSTSFNSVGLMTSLTDQAGTITTFPEYNHRGQLKRKTDPLLKDTIFEYDDAGRLDYVIDRNGDTTSFTYTPTNKMETITYPDTAPDPSVSFTYNQHDDLTEMQDRLGTSSYNYDAAHRLIIQTDANGFTVSYSYDDNGNLKSLTYPGNKTVMYTYDALNRLKTVTNWLSQTATYTYDDAGRLDRADNFNGTITDYDYDNANRLTDLENRQSDSGLIADYHFTLDGNGNRDQITKNEPMMPVLNVGRSTYTYNQQRNRLENANGEILTYDDEGQIYSKGNIIYDFDHEHRLISVQETASSDQYYYDAVGNRLTADRNGEITKYIYDAGGNLLAEADDNDTILRYYIHGLGLMAMVESGQVYTYHFNAVGSTIAMTDAGQNIVNMYTYTQFGIIANEVEQKPQPFKFVGQYGVMTEPNGLYYMRARYYDPEVGRFISEDPIGFNGGDVNLYAYVGNNPLLLIDPFGLRESLDQAGAGGNIVRTFGEVLDNFNNPATGWLGYSRNTILIDSQIAHLKITTGTVVAAVGIGTAVGTLAEDVATRGAGIQNDPLTLTGAARTIAFGITLAIHGVQDLMKLDEGRNNR